jgi:hypothetical protein
MNLPMIRLSAISGMKASAHTPSEQLENLSAAQLADVTRLASIESFQAVAVIPLVLLPVFGLIWMYDRRKRAATPGLS